MTITTATATAMPPQVIALLGIPYVNNGRNVAADGGLDCWGLVCEIYRRVLAVDLPPFLISENALRRMEFDRQLKVKSDWTQISSPAAYAVALYRLTGGTYHCGVVLPNQRSFMHCRAPVAVVEALDATPWRRLLKGYYEYAHK